MFKNRKPVFPSLGLQPLTMPHTTHLKVVSEAEVFCICTRRPDLHLEREYLSGSALRLQLGRPGYKLCLFSSPNYMELK